MRCNQTASEKKWKETGARAMSAARPARGASRDAPAYGAVARDQETATLRTRAQRRGTARGPDARGPGAVHFAFGGGAAGGGRVERLVCGSEHVVCLVEREGDVGRREVWGWGWNEHGNLGVGHTEDVDAPVRVWPPAGETASAEVVDLWAGCGTSWVLVRR